MYLKKLPCLTATEMNRVLFPKIPSKDTRDRMFQLHNVVGMIEWNNIVSLGHLLNLFCVFHHVSYDLWHWKMDAYNFLLCRCQTQWPCELLRTECDFIWLYFVRSLHNNSFVSFSHTLRTAYIHCLRSFYLWTYSNHLNN